MIKKVNINIRGEKLVISIPVDVIQDLLVGKAPEEVLPKEVLHEDNKAAAQALNEIKNEDGIIKNDITQEVTGDNQVVPPQPSEGDIIVQQ